MSAKVSKSSVEYRDAPKGNQQCSKCSMFRSPDACTLVKGKIAKHGWCKEFDKKD